MLPRSATVCWAGRRRLAERHPLVGDVRGAGLFLGVELVRDRGTLEPAAAEAAEVANRMRDFGVLLGTDGPHHNVLKIRPPLCFAAADADLLLDCLDAALSRAGLAPVTSGRKVGRVLSFRAASPGRW